MTEHYIPLSSVRVTRMEIPFSECVGNLYHIYVLVPFLPVEKIKEMENRLKVFRPVIIAPFLVHYLKKRYAIYHGPMAKITNFEKAKTWNLTYGMMKDLFVPQLFKYHTYWYELIDFIISMSDDSFLANPMMALSGMELHRLDEFTHWYGELVRIFDESCNASHVVKYSSSFSNIFTEDTLHGRTQHVIATCGVVLDDPDQYRSRTIYASHTTSLQNRIRNDSIRRVIERPDYS